MKRSNTYLEVSEMSGWTVVGYCPKCGAPIYAPTVWMGVTPPPVYYTCECAGGNRDQVVTSG